MKIEKIYNQDAEVNVLSSILVKNDSICEVIDIVNPGDFYNSRHKTIYAKLREMYEDSLPMDIVTLSEKLGEKLKEVGGVSYLEELINSSFNEVNIKNYSSIVKEKSNYRQLKGILTSSLDKPEPIKLPNFYRKMAVEMTDRVHAFDSKIFLQLTAGLGRSAPPYALNGQCVAPSPTSNIWIPKIECRELTTREVEEIVKTFAESAKIAQESEFDGVEIHAVHEGYLLDCFAMSLFNKRTDKYGGDLRGRLTFAIEIVQSIKEACGADFPVILRFSIKSYIKALRQGGLPGEEFEELGRDVSEALEAAKILEEAGYDAFDADAGTYDS